MNNMCSFFRTKCVIILLLAILTYQYLATGKNTISQTKDFCPAKKELIQFREFRPEHSAEEYDLPPQVTDSLTLDLSFCTSTKMAIIAELKNFTAKQTATLEIVDGFLSVSVEEIGNPKPRCVWSISDKPVNDQTLHTVKFKVSPQLLSIELYHMYKLVGAANSLMYSSCLGNKTLSKLHRLILGGVIIDRPADSKIQVLYSFVGCMRNIRINGRSVENVAKQLTSADVTPGCPEFPESCTQVCPETAEYKDGFCVCPEGKEIDANDTCSPSCSCIKCQNGGTCDSVGSSAHCECLSGFSGALCEKILNPCDGILCNNGSCITNNDSTSYECICSEGYKGKFCDKKDMCFVNPCHNGGTCGETLEDDFICVCPPGVSGKRCDQRLDITKDNNRVLLLSAVGGVFGVLILIPICFCIWKYRKRLPCLKINAQQTTPARTTNQEQRRTLLPRIITITIENCNNRNNENSISSVESPTAVTGRTEQPAHPEDSVDRVIQHNNSFVPTITCSRNEKNCVISFTPWKSISNKATSVTKNIASCVIYGNISIKKEGHKTFLSLKTDSHFVNDVEGNSDKSHVLDRNKRNSDQTDNVKSHDTEHDEENSAETEDAKSHDTEHDDGNSAETEDAKSHDTEHDEGNSAETEDAKSHDTEHDEGNSAETEDAKSHDTEHDEGNSAETEDVKSHCIESGEGNFDKKHMKSDSLKREEDFHREVEENDRTMRISYDEEDARELYHFKDHEGNCNKKTGEFSYVQKDEETYFKDVQKSYSSKGDGGNSGKEVQKTHSMKGEEGCSNEEENFEGNNTEITELNEPRRAEKTELQKNLVSQCQQNTSILATEPNEIFI